MKKQDIINKIEQYSKITEQVIKIQSTFRGFIVRRVFTEHSCHLPNCLNETDFYTLEPLRQIPHPFLYTTPSTNKCGGYYGFHLFSLMALYGTKHSHKTTCLTNPYNRAEIDIKPILTRHKTIQRICPELYQVGIGNLFEPFINLQTENDEKPPQNILKILVKYELMTQTQRIRELFIEFDLLGNYTDSRWFVSLSIAKLKQFYLALKEQWFVLEDPVKLQVFPLGSPFELVGNKKEVQKMNFKEVQITCIQIMESMTYCSINRETQKLGVFVILVALTRVNYEASRALQHLSAI